MNRSPDHTEVDLKTLLWDFIIWPVLHKPITSLGPALELCDPHTLFNEEAVCMRS